MSKDPFQPTVPTCKTCRFWARFETSESGDCRRYAPRPDAMKVELKQNSKPVFRRGSWVWTHSADWCGEWSQAVDR